MLNRVKRGKSEGQDNPVGSAGNGMKVPANLYSTGGAEPTNNPPTSARHPTRGDEMCGAARSNVQRLGIKSLSDNITVTRDIGKL